MKKTNLSILLFFLVSSLAFSPIQPNSINTLSASGSYQVLTPQNVKDIKLITHIGQGYYSGEFVIQPDGDLIAAATKSGIALLDRLNGKQTGFIPLGFQATALSISADGDTLAAAYSVPTGKLDPNYGAGYRQQIAVYSLPDGKAKRDQISDLKECGNSPIWQIAFLPDGGSLVFEKKYGARGDKKMFCTLALKTGAITHTLDIPETASSTLSPDGQYAALVQRDKEGMTDKATIYDTRSFKPLTEITFPEVKWPEIAFTGRGNFVLRHYEGENDSTPYQVSFWSLPTGTPLLTLHESEKYTLQDFSASVSQETNDMIMSQDISPDGRWAATGSQNGKVKLWDAKTGLLVKELGTLSWTSHHLTWNPGGLQSSEMNSYVTPLAFSSDGKTLAAAENLTTAGQSGQIHLYQMPDGQETAAIHGDNIANEKGGLSFSPDSSRIVYGGFIDGHAEVHNVSDGILLTTLTGHTAVVNRTLFSPDGKWIATASDDHTIRLWDASGGSMVRILSGHTQRVNQIAFSPDSQWLVSGADDNSIRRWKTTDGSLIDSKTMPEGNWRLENLSVLADSRSVVYTAVKYPSPLTGYITHQILWDTESGKEQPVGGGKVTISGMAPDGRTFTGYGEKGTLTGTLDSDGKMTLAASNIRSPNGNGALTDTTLTPDNRILFSGNGFGLHAWELSGTSASFLGLLAVGEPMPSYGQYYEMSPDGKILAFASGGVVYLLGVPTP